MMISTFRSALLAVTLVFAPLAVSAHAQDVHTTKIHVPFDFQNGSEVMPAGVYTLSQPLPRVLAMSDGKHSSVMMVRLDESNGRSMAQGKAVFERIGEKYFLREVWHTGESSHIVCETTSAESKARKSAQTVAATTKPAEQTVQVALFNCTR